MAEWKELISDFVALPKTHVAFFFSIKDLKEHVIKLVLTACGLISSQAVCLIGNLVVRQAIFHVKHIGINNILWTSV
jgi:hypothetical protein